MLTNSKSDGSWSVIGSNGKEIPWKDVPVLLYGALCKLRDYEKTGLSPDTIAITRDENTWLISENSRLIAENRRLKALVDTLEKTLKGSGNE